MLKISSKEFIYTATMTSLLLLDGIYVSYLLATILLSLTKPMNFEEYFLYCCQFFGPLFLFGQFLAHFQAKNYAKYLNGWQQFQVSLDKI